MQGNILVTGITGFVGSHLADYILEAFPDATLWGTKRYHLSRMDNVRHIREQVRWVDCDLTDAIGTREMIREVKPDRIFHMAAESFVSPSWKHPHRYMSVNYDAMVNVLDAVRESGADTRILIPGSGEEYGEIHEDEIPIGPETPLRPVNPYAVTKIAQDLIGYVYFKSYGTKVVRVRTFNHEGPRRDKVFGIPWYAYQVARIEAGLQEPVVKVGHVDDLRNFTHVKDIVRAYCLAMEQCEPGELYLVGSESESSIFTFRQALEQLIALSTVSGITYQEDARYVRPTNVPRLLADTSRFRELTGWEPNIDFTTILSDTLNHWRERVAQGE
ncbi:MAG: GDP-mannose 4,6-dehydratase [Gemmatimonadota bacterium]